MVYQNCKIYGPYTSKQDGRKRIVVALPDGTRKTVSYPKYLVECSLNRYLLEDETVDHIDCDFTNDNLTNLRVIDRKLHSSEDVLRNKEMSFICQMCNSQFKLLTGKEQTDYRNNRRKNKAGPFCSKSCAGKYGAYLKNGYMEKLEVQEIKTSEKYRLKRVCPNR